MSDEKFWFQKHVWPNQSLTDTGITGSRSKKKITYFPSWLSIEIECKGIYLKNVKPIIKISKDFGLFKTCYENFNRNHSNEYFRVEFSSDFNIPNNLGFFIIDK